MVCDVRNGTDEPVAITLEGGLQVTAMPRAVLRSVEVPPEEMGRLIREYDGRVTFTRIPLLRMEYKAGGTSRDLHPC